MTEEPSLISPMVSVDVQHHVYLLFGNQGCSTSVAGTSECGPHG